MKVDYETIKHYKPNNACQKGGKSYPPSPEFEDNLSITEVTPIVYHTTGDLECSTFATNHKID